MPLGNDNHARVFPYTTASSLSCGASLQDLHLPTSLNEVYVGTITCFEPIKELY